MEAQDDSVSSRHQTHNAEKDWTAQGLPHQWRKIYKPEAKLEDYSSKQKGMHMKTITRIVDELIRLNVEREELFDLELSRRLPWM
jgi:hypothetical protein